MKKQNLLFMILAVAGLSVTFSAVGQEPTEDEGGLATNNTDARATSCADDPLAPIAGVPYKYEAEVTPEGGTATWFVTTQPNFIEDGNLTKEIEKVGDDFIGAAEGLGSGTSTGLDITWKNEGFNTIDYDSKNKTPLFVGILYEAHADACANNIQVWKIEPQFAFTLDITNVKHDTKELLGYDVEEKQCFDIVNSAKYDLENDTVKMDYGTNTMIYEVIAANFSSSFNFKLKLSGLKSNDFGKQTADISWGYTPETAGANKIGTDKFKEEENGKKGEMEMDGYEKAETNETNTSKGVSIFVQVVVHNNGYEGLVDTPITLAVDGTDSIGKKDKTTGCVEEGAYVDAATQTLKARPTIDNPNPKPFATKKGN